MSYQSCIYTNWNAFHQTGATKREVVRSIFHIGKRKIYVERKTEFYFSNAEESFQLEPDNSIPWAKQMLSLWEGFWLLLQSLGPERGHPLAQPSASVGERIWIFFVYVSLMGQRGLLSNRTALEGHGKTQEWDRQFGVLWHRKLRMP